MSFEDRVVERMSTAPRQWAPKSAGQLMAEDEDAMLDMETTQEKRQLTPAKTPNREAKKQNIAKEEATDHMNVPEGADTQEFNTELAILKDDLAMIHKKLSTQGNQVLFTLKTQADADRQKCASEFVVINWVKYKKVTNLEDEYAHRERIIEWCLREAGVSKRYWPADREYSHQVRADSISPQTHVKLAQPWVRKKLLEWQKEKYPKGIPEWWNSDETQALGEKSEMNTQSNGTLLFTPQIPIWDRIKGAPMRTAMVVLREVFEYKDFAPVWPENAIKAKGSYLVWITFNPAKGIAKIYVDHSIDFEIFVEAFQSQFATSYGQGQGSKSKGKGRGKGKAPTKTMSNSDDFGKFPFTFLFNQVADWHKEYEAYKSESRSEAAE